MNKLNLALLVVDLTMTPKALAGQFKGPKTFKAAALLSVILLLDSHTAQSATCGVDAAWRVSFGALPGITEPGKKSFMIEFVEKLADDAGVKLKYEIVPFKRSILSVSAGRADMHIPMLQPDDNLVFDEKLKYSKAALFEVPFYIYTAAGSKLSVSDVGVENKLIETEAAHTNFFPFPVVGSDCMECSLEKLVRGRIDAFVYAEETTERTIKKLGLGSLIRREFYKSFPVKAILPRSECGEAFNRKLEKLVPAARRTATQPAFKLNPEASELSN